MHLFGLTFLLYFLKLSIGNGLWSVLLFGNVKVDERSNAARVINNFKVHADGRYEVGMKFNFCIWLNIDRGKKFR